MNQNDAVVHIGVLISTVTGVIVDPDGFQHLDHWLARVGRVGNGRDARESVAVKLQQQFPWLNEINADAVTGDNWKEWLNEQIVKYGRYHEVAF